MLQPHKSNIEGKRRGIAHLRWLGIGLSLIGHPLILLALVMRPQDPTERIDPAPMMVELAQTPPPQIPIPIPPALTEAKPTQSLVEKTSMPVRRPKAVAVLDALPVTPASASIGLSDAQLAGAGTAESGGGGACNMVGAVQNALRKDTLVQAAVARAAGRAILVWDGDWVRDSAEAGKGLAAVREAIIWEVAFAPSACRREVVHGLVVLSPGGSVRLALGAGQWRWSDLLSVPAASER